MGKAKNKKWDFNYFEEYGEPNQFYSSSIIFETDEKAKFC